jgi:hypothetical protein
MAFAGAPACRRRNQESHKSHTKWHFRVFLRSLTPHLQTKTARRVSSRPGSVKERAPLTDMVRVGQRKAQSAVGGQGVAPYARLFRRSSPGARTPE